MTLNLLQKNKVLFTRRELLIGFAALIAILTRLIFPSDLAGEWLWLNLLLFLIFPAVVVKFLLKEKLENFGFSVGKFKLGATISIIASVLFFFLNYCLITKSGMRNYFFIYPPIATSFITFLWFELIISGAVFFSREFFFRGFLQMGLEKRLGYCAIPLQSLIYALFFLKISWLTVGTAFLSALIAGYITRVSRSVYYSFAFLWLVSVASDIILIKTILNSIK